MVLKSSGNVSSIYSFSTFVGNVKQRDACGLLVYLALERGSPTLLRQRGTRPTMSRFVGRKWRSKR